jgi:hypothetical protein
MGMSAVNVFALSVSVIALGLSVFFSSQQIRNMRASNSVPVAIDLLTKEWMQDEFQQREIMVVNEIGQHDPAIGFSGLPQHLGAAAYNVALLYDSLGIFVAFGFIDETLVLSTRNYRIRRIWAVLEPHILGERELRGATFLDFLEDLAYRAHQHSPEEHARRLDLHTMPRGLAVEARLK